jgi:hypothetical protein
MSRRLGLLAAAFLLVSAGAAGSSLQQQMREVERLRGVRFKHDVTQRTIDRSELRPLIEKQLASSVPYSLDEYVEILNTLQLVERSVPNVLERMLALYDSQVLAFYDPLTHTYFAIRQLPERIAGISDAGALTDSVVIHELVHALQDQRFDAAERERALQRDVDGELAYHALLEGEASLLMLNYLLEKSGQPFDEAVKNDLLIGAMSAAAAAEKSLDGGAPRYFLEALKFPYLEGLKLVIAGYRRGGWKEIDRMHGNPPRTTREVLHPTEYFARLAGNEKAARPFAPTLSPGVLTIERLGEFHWRFLVGSHAEGWLDDRVTVKCDGNVIAETRWEDAAKAVAFRDAYARFLRGRGVEPIVSIEGATVNVTYQP